MGTLGPPLHWLELTCKCPRCGIEHTMRLQWVSDKMPRKYCARCKNIIESIDDDLLDRYSGLLARNRSSWPSVDEP